MSSSSPMEQEDSDQSEIHMSGVRRNLKNSFDSLLENKGDSMKVYCRVRPMLQSEEDSGYTECIAAVDDKVVRAVVPTSSVKFKNNSHNGQEIIEDFKYTLAFGPEAGQFSFFQETIMDIMQGFIEGQNGLIFSYGITNSGKTYTLQGDDANPGIIPMALNLFFACVEHQLLDGISVKPDKYSEIIVLNPNETAKEQHLKEQLLQIWENESGNKSNSACKSFGMTLCDAFYDNFKFEERQTTLPPEEMIAAQSALYMKEIGRKSANEQAGLCSIWVSFIEIYNEYVYDLLQPNILQRQKLSLAEDQNGDVYVKGAREICVSSSEEAIKLLHVGRRNLRIASTKLNYQSSRSHCIFTLKVIRLFDEENASCGCVNRISFCDLAGSERATKSQASGLRLKEAGYINQSLLVLGRCLDQLRLNQTSRDKKIIPYRESKLTRLFYSHFLGKGKATMIANVSPCDLTFDETLNVLRFSALAKELTLNDSYISMASNSIQNLTTQWGKTKARAIADVSHDQSSDFDISLSYEIQEKDEIIEKLFELADNLRVNLKKEKQEKAELEIELREKICEEFSALSDQLIENQRNISEQRIEGLKKSYQTRIENMEKMYQDKIRELSSQLEEYEASSEESINESMDKGNETSMSKVKQEAKSVQSPESNLFEEKQEACQEDVFEKLECASSEHAKLISENKGLKLDISALKNELDSTTEQLQKYTVMIVGLQDEIKQYEEKSVTKTDAINISNVKVEPTEAETLGCEIDSLTEELKIAKEQLEQTSILLKQARNEENAAKENCDVLRCKLQEANEVLEEFKKEFEELKIDSLNEDRELLDLIEMKQNLEENVSSLSEQLAHAIAETEQLKKDKHQAEDLYSQQSIEILKIKTECELKCEQVGHKLEESKKVLEERKSKISELECECNNLKNDNIKLLEDKRAMEEQLALLSEEAGSTVSEEQYNELDSKYKELTRVFEEQHLKLEEATESLKEIKLKLSELETEYTASKVNYNKLSDEHNSLMEHCNDMKKELDQTVSGDKYEELVSKVAELSQALEEQQLELEIATEALKEQKSKFNELELECTASKNENAKLLEEYSCMKEKLNSSLKELENNDAEQLNRELMTKLEDVVQEKNAAERLSSELLAKLEDAGRRISTQDFKIDELETKCSELGTQFENSSQALDEQKLAFGATIEKCNSYEDELACLSEELSTLKENLDDMNTEKLNIDASNKELQTKLEESALVVENQKLKIDELENKCFDLGNKLQIAADSLRDQKAKFDELSIEAISYQEKYSTLEMEFNNKVKAMPENDVEKSSNQKLNEEIDAEELEKCTLLLEKEQSKVSELKLECTNYKNDYEKLVEEHRNLCEEFTLMKQDLNAAKLDSKNLAEEKNAVECALQKSSSEIQENNAVTNEMKIKLEKSNETVEAQKLEIEELVKKCNDLSSKLEEAALNKTTFQESNAEWMEKYSELESEHDKMKAELDKITAISNTLKSQNEVLDNQYLETKAENDKLSEKCEYLEKILESVNEKFDALNIDYEQLKSEKVTVEKSHAASVSELHANLELSEKQVEELQETLQVFKDENAELKKELKNIENESQAQQQDYLLNVLGKCELNATNKIKILHSSSLNNLQEISDLKRQVKEKEASIDQLEKAIHDAQKVKKENEAKLEKQISSLKHQHAIEIEEIMHLKRITDEENTKLQSALARAENLNTKTLNEEKNHEDDNSVKPKTNKEKNHEDENSVKPKTNKGIKKKTSSSKEDKEDSENKGVPKRRKPLRTQQAKVFEELEESDCEIELKPKLRTRKRKSDEEYDPVPKKATKKKISKDAENMSPVQKAISYVGAKFRSVAQTVSSVPSPRVTRGRKKLFNVEAESSSLAKWKI